MRGRMGVEFVTGRTLYTKWGELTEANIEQTKKEFFGEMFSDGIGDLKKFNMWGFVLPDGSKIPYISLNSAHVVSVWVETRDDAEV